MTISVWVRWFVVGAWVVQMNYRPNFTDPNYFPNMLIAITTLALNGYVHYHLLSNRRITWRWALFQIGFDTVMLTLGLANSGGFSNSFFTLYYATLAMFAVVFTSFRLSLLWVTSVAAAYAAMSLMVEPGVDFGIKEEKILFTRIVIMYAVVIVVNLISRFERIRRREAVERERELIREQIELSRTIHDTVAQSTYVMGLGLETARELAETRDDNGRGDLAAKLEALHGLSKSMMWELRHPINVSSIVEGRELNRVLRSHVSTFTTITSIPTELVCCGNEPQLSSVTRGLLFSILHKAMTNALQHSRAERVSIALSFGNDELSMSISDNGVGLPDDYADRGHGFRNMKRDAELMGGALEVSAGEFERGTTVRCVVPYGADRGGV